MASLSKADYLKKYLSSPNDDDKQTKKKRKSQKSSKQSRVKIVDDDVDFKSLLPSNLENTLEEDVGDHDPTVAAFIDERPEDVVRMEEYQKNDKWKVMSDTKSKARKRHDNESSIDSQQNSSKRQQMRHDSDSEGSGGALPQKRKQTRHDSDSDQSLERTGKSQRHDSDSDNSPQRQRTVQDSDSDISPQRQTMDSDESPPRRHRNASDSDVSPPRRRKRSSDSDHSPPRKKSREKSSSARKSKERKSRFDSPNQSLTKDSKGRVKQTLGGAKAGLSSAKDMFEEAKKLKAKEAAEFAEFDPEVLGKGAKTQVRKTGRKTRKQREEEEMTDEKKEQLAKQAQQYEVWGKGLTQVADKKQNIEEALYEMSKPLTRGKDDQDLEDHLKGKDRDGDPMLAYIKKKRTKTKKITMPQYKGPEPPPNRFGLRPGYRWDGVDRSTGFEKQFFAKQADKKALKEIAYKWSVEDM